MEKLLNNTKFITGFFAVLFLLTLLNTCNVSGNRKSVVKLQKEVDSLRVEVSNHPTQEQLDKSLRIEGLKAEKRMIQATDRKILDVQRQTEIDKEIQDLQGK
jgi:hypothetical protein